MRRRELIQEISNIRNLKASDFDNHSNETTVINISKYEKIINNINKIIKIKTSCELCEILSKYFHTDVYFKEENNSFVLKIQDNLESAIISYKNENVEISNNIVIPLHILSDLCDFYDEKFSLEQLIIKVRKTIALLKEAISKLNEKEDEFNKKREINVQLVRLTESLNLIYAQKEELMFMTFAKEDYLNNSYKAALNFISNNKIYF